MLRRLALRPVPAAAAAWSIALATGCWGNVASEYPPGLEPLEDNAAPAPLVLDQLVLISGTVPEYAFAHGRGLVSASPAAVWQAIQDPEVVVSWRQTSRHLVTPTIDPAYELRYMLHYEVDNIIDVSWDEDWRYGTITGSPTHPELAIARYQKVFGTTFIDLIEGSIQVLAVDEVTAEIQLIEHVKATQGGTTELVTTLTDRFASVVARVDGLPLPR